MSRTLRTFVGDIQPWEGLWSAQPRPDPEVTACPPAFLDNTDQPLDIAVRVRAWPPLRRWLATPHVTLSP